MYSQSLGHTWSFRPDSSLYLLLSQLSICLSRQYTRRNLPNNIIIHTHSKDAQKVRLATKFGACLVSSCLFARTVPLAMRFASVVQKAFGHRIERWPCSLLCLAQLEFKYKVQ